MAISTEQLITLTRIGASGAIEAYYPKTVGSQVFLTSTYTVKDHVDDVDIHLSAAERDALDAINQANGFVQLDANAFVPTANINPAVLAITKEYATTTAMLTAAGADVAEGQLVWVNDASTGDSSVASGWAIYRKQVDTDPASKDYSTLAAWTKVSEGESLDVVVQWANIQGKPTSSVADIDDAVEKKHTHTNKAALDDLADATTGTAPDEVVGLTYKGEAVAFQSEVSHLAMATTATMDTVAAGLVENDLMFVVTNNNYTHPASVASDPTVNTGA